MASRRVRRLGCLGLVAAAFGGAAAGWLYFALGPMPEGEPFYVRYESSTPLEKVLEDLSARGVVRSGLALSLYARMANGPRAIATGTYQVRPGMRAQELLDALKKPVRRLVRIPETNWAARNARLLEQLGVCSAREYLELVAQPGEFQRDVSFPLPKRGTLEGYLFPDTYDFPPLLGPRGVVLRQLRAFERKVWPSIPPNTDLARVLTIASLVELEVQLDEERPIVAGVIENRLARGMPLEIDASVLYALDEWKALTRKEIRETDSPYNTYRRFGLPPGPICSPSLKSVEAALQPAKHRFLFYVALPGGKHLFSETYDEHLRNVRKRKEALAALDP